MSIHGVLGENTHYPSEYAPQVLYAIARKMGRDKLDRYTEKVNLGVDWWHAFELSWLNKQGVSQVAMARFSIPANSTYIIESKSLKLYLNSLNFTEFNDWTEVEQTICRDLSKCANADVKVELFSLQDDNLIESHLSINQIKGDCLEELGLLGVSDKIEVTDDVRADFLSKSAMDTNHLIQKQCYYSNLLRSNCPVTNQPDWGSVQIDIECQMIDKLSLLKYLLSFRKHNGFHEQCVEQIFSDLMDIFSPKSLMVRAWYTRRGGIDINPCRVSDLSLLPQPSRLIRQ